MHIAVIGGKLQGVEAAYLATKAGFSTTIIDKNPQAPAAGLCSRFLAFEFGGRTPFPELQDPIDLILPAIEKKEVLSLVRSWACQKNIPLAFDMPSYGLSASKTASNRLFARLGLPMPAPYPHCSFPVVAKPDHASGSRGVRIIKDRAELDRLYRGRPPKDVVVQEFVRGPSYSIEVLGIPGRYHTCQVTDLGMDKDWDCNRVTAPTRLDPDLIPEFERMALALAEEMCLSGIMDLEAICHDGQLKLLEIDARLPSQTPMAVFWSTGINMVAHLARIIRGTGAASMPEAERPEVEKPVRVEHIRVCGGAVEFPGEHIMGEAGPLAVIPSFLGANEAITSWSPGKENWVATMIFRDTSVERIDSRRSRCYDRIRSRMI